MKYKCPCCGYYTFDKRFDYDICPVCFWEDDPLQFKNENFTGANHVTLVQARKNFAEFGACEFEMIKNVRKPKKDELNGID